MLIYVNFWGTHIIYIKLVTFELQFLFPYGFTAFPSFTLLEAQCQSIICIEQTKQTKIARKHF